MGCSTDKYKTIWRSTTRSSTIDLEQDNITLNPLNQPQDLPAEEDNNQQPQVEEPNLAPEPEQFEQFNMPPNQPL